MLVVGLVAAAAFILVAAAANRRDPSRIDATDRYSGTGGFALRAVSSLPIPVNFGSAEGRAKLGFPPEEEPLYRGVTVIPFLMSPGEDISCLNTARASRPRVLGVPRQMVERGGFRVKTTGTRRAENPWGLLAGRTAEGTPIPAFGDLDSVMWSLHSGLGKRYTIPGGLGQDVEVRFVGVLPGSVFAGELLVSEADFRVMYPAITAPSYFLISVPPGRERAVAQSLRRNLGEMGLEVRETRELLTAFTRVQNTYLSTFVALGGLGMVLGTFGLVGVLLRSALERRREFALLLALGFGRPQLVGVLVLENAFLLLAGLCCGVAAALVAVIPAVRSAATRVEWSGPALVLMGMLVLGLGAVAARAAIREDVLGALHHE
jgi:hypothetical protein